MLVYGSKSCLFVVGDFRFGRENFKFRRGNFPPKTLNAVADVNGELLVSQ